MRLPRQHARKCRADFRRLHPDYDRLRCDLDDRGRIVVTGWDAAGEEKTIVYDAPERHSASEPLDLGLAPDAEPTPICISCGIPTWQRVDGLCRVCYEARGPRPGEAAYRRAVASRKRGPF